MMCVICGLEIDKMKTGNGTWDHGHNAWPIKEGRCCSKCNKAVLRERVFRTFNR